MPNSVGSMVGFLLICVNDGSGAFFDFVAEHDKFGSHVPNLEWGGLVEFPSPLSLQDHGDYSL